MNGRDDRAASISDQNGSAVRHANRDRNIRVVGDNRVGGRTSPRVRITTANDRDLGPVNLIDQQQSIAFDTHFGRDRLPLFLIVTQLQVADREEVWRNARQRFAFECGAPRRLRPLEATARLRKLHEHHWNRPRRD